MDRKKKMSLRSFTAILAVLFLALSGIFPCETVCGLTGVDAGASDVAYAAESASAATIRLVQTEGTVSIKDGDGSNKKPTDNMRLLSGSTISTKERSYAWMNLDDTKAAKLDASSSAKVEKGNKKLDLTLAEGALSFDVSEKLAADESFTIRSSNIVMGIRGTIGIVKKVSNSRVVVAILEGSVQSMVTDPATGATRAVTVDAGSLAEIDTSAAKSQSEGIRVRKIERTDIPGFFLTDIAQGNTADGARRRFNVQGGGGVRSGRIYFACGIDLRGVTEEEAALQLREDQARASFTGEFDPVYYANRYKDLRDAFGYDPVALWKHYRDFGQFEGRIVNGQQEAKRRAAWAEFERKLREEAENSGANGSGTSSGRLHIAYSKGGTISASSDDPAPGELVRLTVEADAGYVFDHWVVDPDYISIAQESATTYTFTMPDEEVSIMGYFRQVEGEKHKITVNVANVGQAASPGTASADKSEAAQGESVTLTATPSGGYVFKTWTVISGGVSVNNSTSATASFIMGSEDVVIEAEFERGYSITVQYYHYPNTTSSYPGAITEVLVNGIAATTARPNDTITITATDQALTLTEFIDGIEVDGNRLWSTSYQNIYPSATVTYAMPAQDSVVIIGIGNTP